MRLCNLAINAFKDMPQKFLLQQYSVRSHHSNTRSQIGIHATYSSLLSSSAWADTLIVRQANLYLPPAYPLEQLATCFCFHSQFLAPVSKAGRASEDVYWWHIFILWELLSFSRRYLCERAHMGTLIPVYMSSRSRAHPHMWSPCAHSHSLLDVRTFPLTPGCPHIPTHSWISALSYDYCLPNDPHNFAVAWPMEPLPHTFIWFVAARLK